MGCFLISFCLGNTGHHRRRHGVHQSRPGWPRIRRHRITHVHDMAADDWRTTGITLPFQQHGGLEQPAPARPRRRHPHGPDRGRQERAGDARQPSRPVPGRPVRPRLHAGRPTRRPPGTGQCRGRGVRRGDMAEGR